LSFPIIDYGATASAFFALPYRRRRALLDKQYGGKASATTTPDADRRALVVARRVQSRFGVYETAAAQALS
jgi:hypothetical protein